MSKYRTWNSRIIVLALGALMMAGSVNAQVISKADEAILRAKLLTAREQHFDTLPIGERVAAVGKLFLGTPYVAGTLDTIPNSEKLIVNLHGFDCVTFYETSLALARSLDLPPSDGFFRQLTLLRYRNGGLNGYASRLHYTTDYFFNGEQKNVLFNITRNIGGDLVHKDTRTINFMTQHRSFYKQLASDSTFAEIQSIEASIHSIGGYYYIPKEDVAKIESKIRSGDILGITTNIPGLDCSHTGIAVRMPDGRIHFMHASSLKGKVIVSDEPLAEYLTHSSHQTGIIVARPLEVAGRMKSKSHLLK
ncbi:MAG: DUF1460 domain-containing protein [Bacteroidota bacterium]|nr:DUF1460 domain-containing protein [Bacteroidota bacterium]MDP4233697.1 DUF1460 domain-containing protein [Bacteroidota bacterium]MDP4242336.1 DUF1460 domain-containing protein [Bacteroidota bacterium]MDP4288712.1 DUF1460 domain-containing protein [Bacteroidota bacterium]